MNHWRALTAVLALTVLLGPAVAESAAQTGRRPSINPRLNAIRRPTVSPYLELLNTNNRFGLPSYQAYVRPQIEQQAVNRQQQAEIRRLERDIARQGAANRAGSNDVRGTGHRSYFGNYSHYYTGLRLGR